jgi:hypothetical protein
MAMTDTDELTEQEEMEALLPWYVTGKLDHTDAERVTAYLARHQNVAQQLGLIQEERAAAEAAHDALEGPPPGALDRLMTSVGGARASSGGAGAPDGLLLKIWRGAADFFAAPSPAGVRWAAMAATLVLTVMAAVIMMLVVKQSRNGGEGDARSPVYIQSGGQKHNPGVGGTFLIGFANDATAQGITKFLGEMEATIVDGPKPGGMYKVVVHGKSVDSKTLEKRFSDRKDIVKLVLPGGS